MIRTPVAWLKRVTTRLAIDALRSLKARREVYVGPWLPEPLLAAPSSLTDPAAAPEDALALAQECELALLWTMERLAPEERAAFILRTAFDADYSDIAQTLGKTEVASRQLVSRAARRVRDGAPRYDAPKEERAAMLARFSRACAEQDRETVLSLLAPDALSLTDGGGKVRAALRPLTHAAEIATVFLEVARRHVANTPLIPPQVVLANGAPAFARLNSPADPTLMTLTTDASGLIDWIYVMRNPDKLGLRSQPGP